LKKFGELGCTGRIKYLLFGFLPFLKIVNYQDGRKYFYFFGISFFKYGQKQKDFLVYKTLKLFKFLPVWSKKEWCNSPRSRVNVFGIPFLKFKANDDYSKRRWYLFCFIPIIKTTTRSRG
jgi:hypothetical protein